jgi:hypothetical protein
MATTISCGILSTSRFPDHLIAGLDVFLLISFTSCPSHWETGQEACSSSHRIMIDSRGRIAPYSRARHFCWQTSW